MMTSVVEKSNIGICSPHKNKRKVRADKRLRDSKKSDAYKLPAKNNNLPLDHGLNGVCQMYRDCKADLDSQKQNLGRSNSSLQGGFFEEGSDGANEETDEDVLDFTGWSDSARTELQSLVMCNLDAIFKSALKKILACGYSEEVATKAVMSPGICYGSKDTLSNVVDNMLKFLKTSKEIDFTEHNCFMDLKELEDYLLAEFVYVLRVIRPFSGPGDTLWYLLVSDLNVSDACAVVFGQYDISDDMNSNLRSHALPKNQLDDAMKRLDMDLNPPISIPSSAAPKNQLDDAMKRLDMDLNPPSSAADCQTETPSWLPNMVESKKTRNLNKQSCKEEGAQSSVNVVDWSFVVSRTSHRLEGKGKLSSSRKVHLSGTLKRESNPRQKLLHLDTGCHTHGHNKSTPKQGKFFGLTIDKKIRSCGEFGEFNCKNASMKISKAAAVIISEDCSKHDSTSATVDVNPTSHLCSSHVASSVPVTSSSSDFSTGKAVYINFSKMKKEPSRSSGSCPADFPDCHHEGVTYKDAKGQSTKPDPKAELIFQLVSRSYKLKDQLEQWTEWANSKVLQATLRLTKHKDELNALRQEKKDPERLKQSIEENTMKKLSETKNALFKANGQVEHANCAFRRLNLKNSALKQEMEAAKLRAMESAAICQEISERERKALSSFKSGDKQNSLLQADLNSEKKRYALTHKEFMQARGTLTQLEDKREYELKAKEDLQLQVSSIRKEIEQGEALRKLEEDAFRSKAESNLQKYKDDIQMLEREVFKLSLRVNVNNAAALRKRTNEGHVSKPSSTKKFLMFPEAQLSRISKKAQNSCKKGAKDVKRDRECVMCLSEEISVVFLPCAHQVFCAKCNELHENNGMKDCPSCRSMIECRIAVHYLVL